MPETTDLASVARRVRAAVVRMAHELKTERGDDSSGEAISLLTEPHGGRLVRRVATEAEAREAARLPRIQVDEDELDPSLRTDSPRHASARSSEAGYLPCP